MAARGRAAWEAYHANQFGAERWERLRELLHRELEHLCVPNGFLPSQSEDVKALEMLEEELKLQASDIPLACSFQLQPESEWRDARCLPLTHGDDHVVFLQSEEDRLTPLFFLDGASLVAAHALRVEPEEKVLDACAAPGGKGLVLALSMFAAQCSRFEASRDIFGKLVLNDASKERVTQMQRTISAFLPPVLFDGGHAHGPNVVFTSADVGTSSNSFERHGPYDKILFDAPCISERHLLRDGEMGRLGAWSASAMKVSSDHQLKRLMNMVWLLKEGGLLLYCNNALSWEECDGVIERLIVSTRGKFELEVLPLEEDICRMVPQLAAESTDWGTRLLPDKTTLGPIYFSRIRLVRAATLGLR
eukprot:TRINITY_DN36324_c0_g1_i1.p1 TRINITY_DN36324_c0_g1~~TRINITY_DN36324_c0_g1_i1.p1  ORF type:complete len:362 (+),score=77.07 TRINITY_DN36324_c0_g1_i1:103-1188(+)